MSAGGASIDGGRPSGWKGTGAFPCTLTGAASPTPAAATVSISHIGLVLTVGVGAPRTLRFSEMRVEAGGFEGDFIFCRPTDGAYTVMCNAPGFLDALKDAAGDRLAGGLAGVARDRRRRRRGVWLGAAALGLLAAVVGAALWSVPELLARAVDSVPTSVDRQVGDVAFDSLTVGPRVASSTVNGFVNEVVNWPRRTLAVNTSSAWPWWRTPASNAVMLADDRR